MKKLIRTLMVAVFVLFFIFIMSLSSSALSSSEAANSTYNISQKAINSMGGKSNVYGNCGAYTGWQLYHMGINSSYQSANGNQTYELYTSSNTTSGGYSISRYHSSAYTLKSALNYVTENGTKDVYNLVVCMERGNTSLSYSYGHAMVIHAIIDGVCYFSESSALTLKGIYHDVGVTIAVDINYFCDYIYMYNTGYQPVFEGLLHFQKSNSITVKESVDCLYQVTIPANFELALFDTDATMVESNSYMPAKTSSYRLNCDRKVTLSDGTVRYRFTSGKGNVFYFSYDSSKMSFIQMHNYTYETIHPTCTKDGTRWSECKCGHKMLETLPKKGHNFTKTGYVAPTCQSEGVTAKNYCRRCDYVDTPHTTIPKLDHEFGEWSTVKTASCTEDGSRIRTCGTCKTSDTEKINKKGHNYYTVPGKAATCTANGFTDYAFCLNCDDIKKNIEPIPAAGHKWSEWKNSVEPTVSSEGKAERKCSVCTVAEEKTLPKLPKDGHTHSYGEWKVTKKAGCDTAGVETRSCSVCSVEETKSLSPIGHKYSEPKISEYPTVEKEGKIESICENCKDVKTTLIPKLDQTEKPGDETSSEETSSAPEQEQTEEIEEVAVVNSPFSKSFMLAIIVSSVLLLAGLGLVLYFVVFKKR